MIDLKYIIFLFLNVLAIDRLYAASIIPDTLPIHYPLIDSLGINYESNKRIYQTCKNELEDLYWQWWDRTALYQSYFFSAVSLLLPIQELKSIWMQGFENDPCYVCRDFKSDLDRIGKQPYSRRIPTPMDCLLLREKTFFEKQCVIVNKSFDENLLSQFRATEKSESNKFGQNLIESTTKKLGVYPGRSYLGIDGEALPWFIIMKGDIAFIKKFLPYIEDAVKNKELHPQFLARTIDKIAILEGRSQTYGTQFELVNGEKKYYPIKDIDNLNKMRRTIGLGLFEESYDIYDTVILGKKYRD